MCVRVRRTSPHVAGVFLVCVCVSDVCVFYILDVKHGCVSPRRFFHALSAVYA